MDRDQLASVAEDASKAFRREWDAIAKLSFAIKRISSLTFARMEEAGKLTRQLRNTAIPLHNESIDRRAQGLTTPQAEQELTGAYKDLMQAIEDLPIAGRTKALAALRAVLGDAETP